jgi:hypothetical protein
VPDGERYLADVIARFEARGANFTIWEWAPAYRPYAEISSTFALRFGPNPASVTDVAHSSVLDLLSRVWQRNRVRPSTLSGAGD